MTGHRQPGRIVLALLIAIGLVMVGFLAVRQTAALLAADDPRMARLAAGHPEVVLGGALDEFAARQGRLSPATLADVRTATLAAPLDSRPLMIFAVQDLFRHDDARALATLEAARRLDPRERWTRILLLDRYLRLGRYRDAASEMAVLARLVAGANDPIVAELARLSLDPATRGVVRQTLAGDPGLEVALLTRLARIGAAPAVVLSVATPAALARAGEPGGWGIALVDGLVDRGRYAEAREVWRRLYLVPAALAATPLYDAGLSGLPGAPPFNWDPTTAAIGAADRHAGQLEITYYGRDSGPLAGELTLLAPGRYRFAYVLSGSAAAGGAWLSWSVTCARPKASGAAAPALLDDRLPAAATARRRYAVEFSVPATGCPAQWLRLSGNAGEVASPLSVVVEGLSLQPLPSRQ